MNWFICAFLLVASLNVFSQRRIYQTDRGKVEFLSDAPLELIQALSDQLYGAIDLEEQTFAFAVAIQSFDGFNSPLQKEHFNEKYLNSNKFPKATFSGKLIEQLDIFDLGLTTIRAKGSLDIHGVEQERIIKSDIQVSEKSIKIQAHFSVPLSDHDIEVPKVVNQKIARVIYVQVEAILLPQT